MKEFETTAEIKTKKIEETLYYENCLVRVMESQFELEAIQLSDFV